MTRLCERELKAAVYFLGGWGATLPNIFEIARKMVKKFIMLQESWPKCFPWPFSLVTVVGQIFKTPPSPVKCLVTSLT